MLEFAAVGVHGRGRRPAMALAFALLFTPLSPQTPADQDLAVELATAIAVRLAPGDSVALAAAESGVDDVVSAVAQALSSRGFTIGEDGASNATVRLTCFRNIRERGCAADVTKGREHDAVAVTHAIDPSTAPRASLLLDVQPLFSQKAPILDAEVVGDRLFVLDPDRVAMYQRANGAWQRMAMQSIVHRGAWPRDVRGRLQVPAPGDLRVDALLPGTICQSTRDLAALSCVDERQPWPIDVPNAGLDARRNHFSTPEGLPLLNAAPLAPSSGARWLVASPDGRLVFLDADRRPLDAAATGDDVVALRAACADESLVLVVSARRDGSDTIRAYAVVERRLLPRATPVDWRGQVTALWSDAAHATATAVVRSEGGERYDAFHIRFECDR
jgi:hypothetical protein